MGSNPSDLRYTDKHTWVSVGDKYVTFGITAHAAEQLGEVSFAESPYPGELFKTGELIGRLSGASGSSAYFMPFTGQINHVNPALASTPAVVSEDPYDKGWLLRIEPADMADADALMDAEAYAASLAGE